MTHEVCTVQGFIEALRKIDYNVLQNRGVPSYRIFNHLGEVLAWNIRGTDLVFEPWGDMKAVFGTKASTAGLNGSVGFSLDKCLLDVQNDCVSVYAEKGMAVAFINFYNHDRAHGEWDENNHGKSRTYQVQGHEGDARVAASRSLDEGRHESSGTDLQGDRGEVESPGGIVAGIASTPRHRGSFPGQDQCGINSTVDSRLTGTHNERKS